MGNSLQHGDKSREWRMRALLLFVSLLIAMVLAEVATRILYPISDRRDNITLDGKTITSFVAPGTTYRQVSNEYDALTTITDDGYRAPAVDGNPQIVFIGDSFTFGSGLNDDETFVSLYCTHQHRSCANLGLPGSGTLKQVERLEQFIDQFHWRPREVRLFVFAMSSSFSAGNDFVDNYNREMTTEARARGTPRTDGNAGAGLAERIIGLQSVLLRYSNLVRLLKFYAGPAMKAAIVAEPGEERMQKAIAGTQKSLQKLDDLSKRAGFDYTIYLLVPVHDILRGTYPDTLATVARASPRPVIPTAQLFLDSPRDYYYAFDGHLNPQGARQIAEFLIAQEKNPLGLRSELQERCHAQSSHRNDRHDCVADRGGRLRALPATAANHHLSGRQALRILDH